MYTRTADTFEGKHKLGGGEFTFHRNIHLNLDRQNRVAIFEPPTHNCTG